MSNVKNGSEFEEQLAEILGVNEFWATVIPKSKDGSQPSDIIAVNHRGKHLIDAKDCKGGRFVLNRMEENQINSMLLFTKRCGGRGWFAFRYPDGEIYIEDVRELLMMQEAGVKSIGKLPDRMRLEVWLNEYSDK